MLAQEPSKEVNMAWNGYVSREKKSIRNRHPVIPANFQQSVGSNKESLNAGDPRKKNTFRGNAISEAIHFHVMQNKHVPHGVRSHRPSSEEIKIEEMDVFGEKKYT